MERRRHVYHVEHSARICEKHHHLHHNNQISL